MIDTRQTKNLIFNIQTLSLFIEISQMDQSYVPRLFPLRSLIQLSKGIHWDHAEISTLKDIGLTFLPRVAHKVLEVSNDVCFAKLSLQSIKQFKFMNRKHSFEIYTDLNGFDQTENVQSLFEKQFLIYLRIGALGEMSEWFDKKGRLVQGELVYQDQQQTWKHSFSTFKDNETTSTNTVSIFRGLVPDPGEVSQMIYNFMEHMCAQCKRKSRHPSTELILCQCRKAYYCNQICLNENRENHEKLCNQDLDELMTAATFSRLY